MAASAAAGAQPARRALRELGRLDGCSGSFAGSTRGHAAGVARQRERGRLDGCGGGSVAGRPDARPCRRARAAAGARPTRRAWRRELGRPARRAAMPAGTARQRERDRLDGRGGGSLVGRLVARPWRQTRLREVGQIDGRGGRPWPWRRRDTGVVDAGGRKGGMADEWVQWSFHMSV
jgi:hypothetical protein